MAEVSWLEVYQHETVMGQHQPNGEVQGRHWETLNCSSQLIVSTSESLKGDEWKLSAGDNLEAEMVLE